MSCIGVAALEDKAIARSGISALQKIALILGGDLCAVIFHIVIFIIIN